MSEETNEEINTIAEFMEKLNKVKEFVKYRILKKINILLICFIGDTVTKLIN